MANIGIIGYGIVGKAVEYGFKEAGLIAKWFKKGNTVLFHDKYKPSPSLKEVVEKSEFIFVCLPTPFNGKTNKIDLSIMDEAIKKIAEFAENTDKIIIIKSTIVPGTTKRYAQTYPNCNFCFNPEFLTESNYLNDFIKADRIVIGAEDDYIKKRVEKLYRERFPKIPIFLTDPITAELSKYMANSHLAAKVIFANEIYDLCQKLKVDYDQVKEIVVADRRIGKTHFDVTKERGFGGKCFPKDIVALIGLYNELGIDASLLKTVWKKNLKIRKIRDWEDIPGATSENHNFKKA